MRLVLFRFGQVLEVFVGLGHWTRDDIALRRPDPEVDGFAAGAAKREVLLLPGSSLPADRTKLGTFRHDVRRKS
jgi:hypothetical protein